MSDLISRQAAIDAFNTNIDELVVAGKENADAVERYLNRVIDEIKQLPPIQPAEPQIIRCKDCKHHWTHKCMDSMPIERCDLGQTFYDAEVDFCSLAEKREVNNESN